MEKYLFRKVNNLNGKKVIFIYGYKNEEGTKETGNARVSQA